MQAIFVLGLILMVGGLGTCKSRRPVSAEAKTNDSSQPSSGAPSTRSASSDHIPTGALKVIYFDETCHAVYPSGFLNPIEIAACKLGKKIYEGKSGSCLLRHESGLVEKVDDIVCETAYSLEWTDRTCFAVQGEKRVARDAADCKNEPSHFSILDGVCAQVYASGLRKNASDQTSCRQSRAYYKWENGACTPISASGFRNAPTNDHSLCNNEPSFTRRNNSGDLEVVYASGRKVQKQPGPGVIADSVATFKTFQFSGKDLCLMIWPTGQKFQVSSDKCPPLTQP